MAERLGADYVELANTQYYGWAWHNRDQLLPSREQLKRAEEVTQGFRERLAGRMKIYFVVPDYFETRPKPCMNGLGSIFLTIAPDGTALPCHAARMLPGLEFPNVREADVAHPAAIARPPAPTRSAKSWHGACWPRGSPRGTLLPAFTPFALAACSVVRLSAMACRD